MEPLVHNFHRKSSNVRLFQFLLRNFSSEPCHRFFDQNFIFRMQYFFILRTDSKK